MLLKTNPVFPLYLREGACYLFSLFWIAEQHRGRSFSPTEIIEFAQYCIRKKYMKDDCTILDGTAILQALGVDGRFLKVDGNSTHFPPDYKPTPGQYIIQCWFNPDTRLNHFVNGTPPNIDYDCLGLRPDGSRVSRTIRDGYLKSVRVVQC